MNKLTLRSVTVFCLWAVCAAVFAQDQPQTLDDLVRLALTRSPQLVASEQNVVSAAASVRQARSSYAPQLTLTGTAGTSGGSAGGTAQDTNAAGLNLGLTFWRSGREASVTQSRASARAAVSTHADRRLTVAELIADDYYAVLAATELVGVAKAGVELAEQTREQVRRQIAAGTVAAVELHTAEDDLAQAKLSLIDARSTVQTALAALKADLGLPYTTALPLAPALMGTEYTAPELAAAVDTALAMRPDLVAQRAVIDARQAAVRVAKAARGPVVEVAGQAGAAYAEDTHDSTSWRLTAGLTWPLADGGYTAAGQTIAERNLLASRADLQTLVDQAAFEVQSALIDLQRAGERIKASEEAVTAATARLHGAEVKYAEGLGILLEVTDARRTLTSTQAELVRARYDYQVAQIALQRAQGTLPLPATATEAQL